MVSTSLTTTFVNILCQSDAQIAETDKQIAYERNVGIIPDPNAGMAPEGGEAPEEGIPADALPPGADQDGDGQVSEEEFLQVAQGDLDLSGDPSQKIDPEMLRLKK